MRALEGNNPAGKHEGKTIDIMRWHPPFANELRAMINEQLEINMCAIDAKIFGGIDRHRHRVCEHGCQGDGCFDFWMESKTVLLNQRKNAASAIWVIIFS